LKPSVPDPTRNSFQSILRITLEEIGKISVGQLTLFIVKPKTFFSLQSYHLFIKNEKS
jgi:hypothetical protein